MIWTIDAFPPTSLTSFCLMRIRNLSDRNDRWKNYQFFFWEALCMLKRPKMTLLTRKAQKNGLKTPKYFKTHKSGSIKTSGGPFGNWKSPTMQILNHKFKMTVTKLFLIYIWTLHVTKTTLFYDNQSTGDHSSKNLVVCSFIVKRKKKKSKKLWEKVRKSTSSNKLIRVAKDLCVCFYVCRWWKSFRLFSFVISFLYRCTHLHCATGTMIMVIQKLFKN